MAVDRERRRADPHVPDRRRPRLHALHTGAGGRGGREARGEVRRHRGRGRRVARRHLSSSSGDEALCVFASARDAIRAAADLQRGFVEETLAAPEFPLTVGIGSMRVKRSRGRWVPRRRAEPGGAPVRAGAGGRDPRLTSGSPRPGSRRHSVRGPRHDAVQEPHRTGVGRPHRRDRRRCDATAPAVRHEASTPSHRSRNAIVAVAGVVAPLRSS